MSQTQILHMDSDIPSIYFPVGSLENGGSCEFATEKCLRYCPSGQLTNEHEKVAFEIFKNSTVDDIVQKIIDDYKLLINKSYNAKMLQWFVWGDCPSFLTEKIAEVILKIQDAGINQYGSTRNKELWERLPQCCNIALTTDSVKLSKALSISSGKRTCCPDINTGYAQFIFGGEIVAKCSGWWCITKAETKNSDCTYCLEHSSGCYCKPDKK